MTKSPRRPIVRYHGGKWKLAPWIVAHFPPHRVYVEPFGGAASVLLRKPRSYAEVYNDLDGEIVNLFRVARDRGEDLVRCLELTPFAREEFRLSYTPSDDPLEQARRTVARAYMGFGSASVNGRVSGFRADSNKAGTTPAHDWRNYPDALPAIIERLRGVVIEHKEAAAVIRDHDSPRTLFYVDPPYVLDTRSKGNPNCKKHQYRHEMTDEDHRALSDALKSVQGMVVLSGYPSDLYSYLYRGWRLVKTSAHADGARDRTECLWLNAPAAEHLAAGLFSEAE